MCKGAHLRVVGGSLATIPPSFRKTKRNLAVEVAIHFRHFDTTFDKISTDPWWDIGQRATKVALKLRRLK
jgi:hypothetical protein